MSGHHRQRRDQNGEHLGLTQRSQAGHKACRRQHDLGQRYRDADRGNYAKGSDGPEGKAPVGAADQVTQWHAQRSGQGQSTDDQRHGTPRRSGGVIATAALDAVAVMVAAPAAVTIRANSAIG